MWDGSKNEAGAYFLLIIKVLPSNAGGAGLIPVQDAKFPWPKSQNIKQQYYYKFNKVFKKKRKSWWGWHGGKTLWMLQTLGSPLLQYDLDLKGIIQESPTRRDIEAERTQAPPLLGKEYKNHHPVKEPGSTSCCRPQTRWPEIGLQWPEKSERTWCAVLATGQDAEGQAFKDLAVWLRRRRPMGKPLVFPWLQKQSRLQ